MASVDDRPQVGDFFEQGAAALAPLREPFLQWLRENAQLDEEVGAEGILEALTAGVGGLLTVRPQAQLTRLAPEDVEALVNRVVPAMVDDVDTDDATFDDEDYDRDEMRHDLEAIWFHFLTFLGETGRWAGSPGDLETGLALLEAEPVDPARVLAEAAEEVSVEEEDTAVLGSFPVLAARAVLEQVGAGVEVPDDAELSADSVTAILAAFDHPVPSTVDADGEPTPLDEVPWLRQVVVLMLDLDLLDGEDETLLAPGAEADGWLGATEEARELRRALVGRFVLEDPATLDGGVSVSEALLPGVFAASVSGQPFDEADLAELGDPSGPLGAAADLGAQELRTRLADLGALGLMSEEAPWMLPRGLWPAVAHAVGNQGDPFEGALEGMFEDGEPVWFESVLGQLGADEQQMAQIRKMMGGH
ncbi:hypothetical protein ACFFKU_00615 [Kineococcus gynurae]|uniref:Hydrolase n=1 Tax=Kineococcus gynurae TaxID=452979 RepID=A0ABV5LPR6_9ACTN